MDTSYSLTHSCIGSDPDEESVTKQLSNAHKSMPPAPEGGFDCNICLEFAQDPVVTFCGHLYCWPCIYKWLNLQSSDQPCPVCKSSLSMSSLIPLYGRGKTINSSANNSKIPSRPSAAHFMHDLLPQGSNMDDENRYQNDHIHDHQPHHHHHIYTDDPYVSSMDVTARFTQPTAAGIAMAVFHSLVGNSAVGFHFLNNSSDGNYSSSGFYLMGTGNGGRRMRQREQQVARGLDMLLFFIFCFGVLCLLFF